MLMVTNIGNAVISVGFFEDGRQELVGSFKISSDTTKTSDEYLSVITNLCVTKGIILDNITGAIVSSVVPQLTKKIINTISSFCKSTPLIVGPGIKTGFQIKIDNPSELGGDIVANTAAAIQLKEESNCVIVADIDTVTTVSAISKNGEFLGCAIFPGIQMSLDTLNGKTAQLPNISVSGVTKSIGKNSQLAISSGVFWGTAFSICGFAEKFAQEMKCDLKKSDFIATGGSALSVIKLCNYPFRYEENLTLNGLYHIYVNTLKAL